MFDTFLRTIFAEEEIDVNNIAELKHAVDNVISDAFSVSVNGTSNKHRVLRTVEDGDRILLQYSPTKNITIEPTGGVKALSENGINELDISNIVENVAEIRVHKGRVQLDGISDSSLDLEDFEFIQKLLPNFRLLLQMELQRPVQYLAAEDITKEFFKNEDKQYRSTPVGKDILNIMTSVRSKLLVLLGEKIREYLIDKINTMHIATNQRTIDSELNKILTAYINGEEFSNIFNKLIYRLDYLKKFGYNIIGSLDTWVDESFKQSSNINNIILNYENTIKKTGKYSILPNTPTYKHCITMFNSFFKGLAKQVEDVYEKFKKDQVMASTNTLYKMVFAAIFKERDLRRMKEIEEKAMSIAARLPEKQRVALFKMLNRLETRIFQTEEQRAQERAEEKYSEQELQKEQQLQESEGEGSQAESGEPYSISQETIDVLDRYTKIAGYMFDYDTKTFFDRSGKTVNSDAAVKLFNKMLDAEIKRKPELEDIEIDREVFDAYINRLADPNKQTDEQRKQQKLQQSFKNLPEAYQNALENSTNYDSFRNEYSDLYENLLRLEKNFDEEVKKYIGGKFSANSLIQKIYDLFERTSNMPDDIFDKIIEPFIDISDLNDELTTEKPEPLISISGLNDKIKFVARLNQARAQLAICSGIAKIFKDETDYESASKSITQYLNFERFMKKYYELRLPKNVEPTETTTINPGDILSLSDDYFKNQLQELVNLDSSDEKFNQAVENLNTSLTEIKNNIIPLLN